jgi:HAD superfamily hydrolase (TIGR01549 family)
VAEWAVIFDVDGVLLELTRDEEELFFTALSYFVPTEDLSRDWNSYRIRNDDDIIAEILERNVLPQSLKEEVIRHYIALLSEGLQTVVKSVAIPGTEELLSTLNGKASLGFATANLQAAAELRLRQVGLWSYVSPLAQGADGGGHKSTVLARLLERITLPRSRVIYIGDNLNDVEAGLQNGVYFIGFSTDPARRNQLQDNGSRHISGNHVETLHIVRSLMT